MVSKRDPKNHDSVTARYVVKGRAFETRSSFVAEPNPAKRELRVGDPVVVIYLPADPSIATLGSPEALIPNEAFSIALAMLVMPTLVLVFGRLKRSRTREKN